MRKIRKKLYSHNTRFFSNLTKQSCYWAGVLAADGYINNQRQCVRLLVSQKDEIVLKRFKRDLEFTGPLLERKWL